MVDGVVVGPGQGSNKQLHLRALRTRWMGFGTLALGCGAEGAGIGWWMGLGSSTTPRALLESTGSLSVLTEGPVGRFWAVALSLGVERAGMDDRGGLGGIRTPRALLGSEGAV